MNLKQIKTILHGLDFQNGNLVFEHFDNLRTWIRNLNQFRRFLNQVNSLPVFQTEVDFLKKSIIYNTDSDSLLLESSTAILIQDNESILNVGLASLLTVLDQLVPADDKESVIIKLPDPVDFEQAIHFQNQFLSAISQNVINSEVNGVVILKEWEPGSFWLTLFLGSSAAVALVAQMAWSAAVVLKKFEEYKILHEKTKGLKIKNETLEEIKRGIEEQMKLVLDSEANALHAHNFKTRDNHEQVERLKMGIKIFMELIDKGAEVHPALEAPESIKNLFPDFKKLSAVESKIKQLPEAGT